MLKFSQANKLRILYFLVFCCTASWLPIFADYLKDKHISGLQTAIIISIIPVLMFLVQPFYGFMADNLGYKKCLLVSSALCSITYLFYLFAGLTFPILCLITVFMALFYNSIQPLLDSLSLELAENDSKFSYGTLRIAGAAGWSFMGVVVGQSIDVSNTNIIFVFSAGTMFLTFLFGLGLKSNQAKVVVSSDLFKIPKDVLYNKSLLILLAIVVLLSMCATPIWYYYSIYMKQNGASASLVGFGISFQGLCELPFFYFSAKIIKKFGLKTSMMVTIFATFVRLLLYSIVKNPNLAIAIELLHGISWSLFWVVCVEYTDTLVPEKWRAGGQSLLYAAYYGVGAILGNLAVGYFQDIALKVADIFLLSGGIVFIVFFAAILFLKTDFSTKLQTNL
jgi:MFS transporter, PPP family, 3-phenylpropionic acid transporter